MASAEHRAKAVLASVAVAAIFAAHYALVPVFLGDSVSPLALGAVRGVAGGLVILAVFRQLLPFESWKTVFRFLVLGLFGGCLNQYLLLKGVQTTDPLSTALIANSSPVLITATAILFRLETLSVRRLGGLLIGFAAISWYSVSTFSRVPYEQSGIGEISGATLVFLSFVSLAIALSLARRWFAHLSPAVLAAGMLLCGGFELALVSFADIPNVLVRGAERWDLGLIFLFEVAISTAVAYALNLYAISKIGFAQASWFNYLQPAFAAILSYLVYRSIPGLSVIPMVVVLMVAGFLVQGRNRAISDPVVKMRD